MGAGEGRMVPRLVPGEVLVLHGFTGVLERDGVRARLMACLSPDEEARRRAFAFARDQDHFLLAHGLKRLALGHCLGVAPGELVFGRGAYGKPYLLGREAGPGFSLSHSGGAVVLALALSPVVGVDVEAPDREAPLEALASIMADEEVADLGLLPREAGGGAPADSAAARDGGPSRPVAGALNPSGAPRPFDRRRAFAYWTLREAFAKAVGVGLSLPRNDVSFHLDGPEGPGLGRLDAQYGARGEWRLHLSELGPAHLLAAAVRTPAPVAWRVAEVEAMVAGFAEP